MLYSRLENCIKRARNNQLDSLEIEIFPGSQAKCKEHATEILSEVAVDIFDSHQYFLLNFLTMATNFLSVIYKTIK